MKNKINSAKTIVLVFVIILIATNFGILFSYYKFYLSDQIINEITVSKNKNNEKLYDISKRINNKKLDETIIIIKEFVKSNGGYILLKDINGNTIYTNKKDISKLFSSTVLVFIEDKEYELTYSIISLLPGMKTFRGFIFYEIVFVSTAILIVYYIGAKKLIDPLHIILKDINDYKFGKIPFKRKLPRKMQKIQNAFVDMVDTLEIEKENQNQIIASISHDIKTPLTSVIGYSNRLKNSSLTLEKKKEYIDKIYSKALLIKDILDEFDDYQSCNLKETMKLEIVSVSKLKNEILNDFKEELEDKNILLNVKSNILNKEILIDLVKIKRVLGNIITNSVNHFNGKKGQINIDIFEIDDNVSFEIADNAGGIENIKDLKKIFEPLYTTDPSRKISGLGLSICKKIITAHNGNIFAKNNEIGGLSIIFVLPSEKFNKI